jgi:hypothetical protein
MKGFVIGILFGAIGMGGVASEEKAIIADIVKATE